MTPLKLKYNIFENIMQNGAFAPFEQIHHIFHNIFKSTGVTVSFFPSQFFPRGKNGPAHSFRGEKTDWSVFSPGERFD